MLHDCSRVKSALAQLHRPMHRLHCEAVCIAFKAKRHSEHRFQVDKRHFSIGLCLFLLNFELDGAAWACSFKAISKCSPSDLQMPVTPHYDWSQTIDEINLRVKLPGLTKQKPDVFVTEVLVKVVAHPYVLVLDLLDSIDCDNGSAYATPGEIVFSLPKVCPVMG